MGPALITRSGSLLIRCYYAGSKYYACKWPHIVLPEKAATKIVKPRSDWGLRSTCRRGSKQRDWQSSTNNYNYCPQLHSGFAKWLLLDMIDDELAVVYPFTLLPCLDIEACEQCWLVHKAFGWVSSLRDTVQPRLSSTAIHHSIPFHFPFHFSFYCCIPKCSPVISGTPCTNRTNLVSFLSRPQTSSGVCIASSITRGILKVFRAGGGFGSGTETRMNFVHNTSSK